MNWEETIIHIRTLPEYADLVRDAFFDPVLENNVERYRASEEYHEILKTIKRKRPDAKTILDIGCGNGITSIAFALDGYHVTAVEPDPSDTVGAGAIRILKDKYDLPKLEVYESIAEEIGFKDNSFDIVFIRQAVHHANDLQKFVSECARVLKYNGLYFSVRDHVVTDPADKERFFEIHPLHHLYKGENAYTSQEYRTAIHEAGLTLLREIKHYESVINYFPMSSKEFEQRIQDAEAKVILNLKQRIGFLGKFKFLQRLYKKRIGFSRINVFDEKNHSGRMYSYLATKK